MQGMAADGPALLDGERLESMMPSGGGRSSVVLLTDRRVVGLSGRGRQREASYASIRDVSSVHLSYEQEGRGSLGWAVLGLVVAVLLFATIDNPIGKLLAPAAAAAISIYLIVDRFTVPGRRVLSFRAGASEVRCDLPDRLDSSEVYEFVNRMYELRDGAVRGPRVELRAALRGGSRGRSRLAVALSGAAPPHPNPLPQCEKGHLLSLDGTG